MPLTKTTLKQAPCTHQDSAALASPSQPALPTDQASPSQPALPADLADLKASSSCERPHSDDHAGPHSGTNCGAHCGRPDAGNHAGGNAGPHSRAHTRRRSKLASWGFSLALALSALSPLALSGVQPAHADSALQDIMALGDEAEVLSSEDMRVLKELYAAQKRTGAKSKVSGATVQNPGEVRFILGASRPTLVCADRKSVV